MATNLTSFLAYFPELSTIEHAIFTGGSAPAENLDTIRMLSPTNTFTYQGVTLNADFSSIADLNDVASILQTVIRGSKDINLDNLNQVVVIYNADKDRFQLTFISESTEFREITGFFGGIAAGVLGLDSGEYRDTRETARMRSLINAANGSAKLCTEEGILYLSAHFIVLARAERDQQRKKDFGMGELTAEQFISKRAEFMTFASNNHEVFLTSTPYGRHYNYLLRINRGARIVRTGRSLPTLIRY